MPAWTAKATPTSLSPGEKFALLNAESLTAAAFTEAFTLTIPQGGGPARLTIFNGTSVTLTLQCSPDNVNWVNLYTLDAGGTLVAVPTGVAWTVDVSPGMYYRLAPGSDITTQSAWVAA